ncbi:hypothetical protein [Pseudomonas chlororaphis]|uniref:hypothetical protein n=1 Tax=Pseudomonas chlororaphis TaxID=587753 RepID=UPI00117B0428|nr:hypothetical protein [Pseudomonas chlororaphis]
MSMVPASGTIYLKGLLAKADANPCSFPVRKFESQVAVRLLGATFLSFRLRMYFSAVTTGEE